MAHKAQQFLSKIETSLSSETAKCALHQKPPTGPTPTRRAAENAGIVPQVALWVLVILYVKVIERGEKSDILATTLQVKKINLTVKINHGWVLNLENQITWTGSMSLHQEINKMADLFISKPINNTITE